MYDLPGKEGVGRIVISRDVVLGAAAPRLVKSRKSSGRAG